MNARGLATKDWISKSGKYHRHRPFTRSTLGALVRNILYIGQVCHNGVVYPGEQPAIVDRALWEKVQQFKSGTRQCVRHGKVEALLSDLLYCAQCGEPMRGGYSWRQGRPHLYYVCRSKKADPECKQKPVASVDLEPSLIEQLGPILGAHWHKVLLQHSLERITYDSRTRAPGARLRILLL